ncbi:MAG: DNA polymerase IV [delta proteobacterium ML8_F1]|nr:MAG: DNA polymerase IV [delta proteobacterium ML8_F1]
MTLYFHIDVNSAYLSWEAVSRLQHGDPLDLRLLPSAVGGDPKSRHGIILAKSIPAKKYGIKTGETLHEALEKCPRLIIVPPDYSLYMQASEAMHRILLEVSPYIQRFSIDESFLMIPEPDADYGTIGHALKTRIRRELGFTVNIGVSSNKLLAKMASDFSKPDALHTLFPQEIPRKMWPLPVEDLFMVGRATRPKLKALGIHTIGDLAATPKSYLVHHFKSHGAMLWEYAQGIESSTVHMDQSPWSKGVGNGTTLPRDIDTPQDAFLYLLGLSESVALRLRLGKKLAQVVVIRLKSSEFKHYTHQRTLAAPTDETLVIYHHLQSLFMEAWRGESLRYLGVRLTGLRDPEPYQYTLFDSPAKESNRALDRQIDTLRLRYGKDIIQRSVFLHKKVKPLIGGVSEEDYLMMSSIL